MTTKAFAKLNLGLHVLRKRNDGFHDIETVFLRIGWHDELIVSPLTAKSPDGPSVMAPYSGPSVMARPSEPSAMARPSGPSAVEMTCSDPLLPTDERNLCVRAALALGGGVSIHLQKQIPYGAGLGGGSSDAAATLQMMNIHREVPLSDEELMHVAADLGSDVPFFLGEGMAYGCGRGEVLESLSGILALRGMHLAIIVPDISVSTADAYAGVVPSDTERADVRSLVAKGSLDDWCARLVNDFEASVMQNNPVIADLKRSFYDAGARYASMSGSGSAVFGVFDSESGALALVASMPDTYSAWTGRAL